MPTIPKTQFPIRWVVSYLRVSTTKQTGDTKTGIQRQIERAQQFLAAHRFRDTGLAISLDLRTGAFEIGIGKVEKNVLEELDKTLEDLASLITDKEQFEKAKTIREKEMAVA